MGRPRDRINNPTPPDLTTSLGPMHRKKPRAGGADSGLAKVNGASPSAGIMTSVGGGMKPGSATVEAEEAAIGSTGDALARSERRVRTCIARPPCCCFSCATWSNHTARCEAARGRAGGARIDDSTSIPHVQRNHDTAAPAAPLTTLRPRRLSRRAATLLRFAVRRAALVAAARRGSPLRAEHDRFRGRRLGGRRRTRLSSTTRSITRRRAALPPRAAAAASAPHARVSTSTCSRHSGRARSARTLAR